MPRPKATDTYRRRAPDPWPQGGEIGLLTAILWQWQADGDEVPCELKRWLLDERGEILGVPARRHGRRAVLKR